MGDGLGVAIARQVQILRCLVKKKSSLSRWLQSGWNKLVEPEEEPFGYVNDQSWPVTDYRYIATLIPGLMEKNKLGFDGMDPGNIDFSKQHVSVGLVAGNWRSSCNRQLSRIFFDSTKTSQWRVFTRPLENEMLRILDLKNNAKSNPSLTSNNASLQFYKCKTQRSLPFLRSRRLCSCITSSNGAFWLVHLRRLLDSEKSLPLSYVR